eukprot:CAMPEP_0172775250 /NCGR_PEP_ID=MMETSP1074-20121228/197606_1 /TAXON_ID=2916 /ORGANISM="Ceratium fusus, Strain PA161109" /LENGTH=555 /DNA_ID=CAMNT_0013611823 /DNA_START=90 /DNA_END=1754 /DNA_ORIENTATION=+
MVVVPERIAEDLQLGSIPMRQLRALQFLGRPGLWCNGEWVVAAAAERLPHSSVSIQEAAVEVLVRVAKEGNAEGVLAAASSYLEHWQQQTREAAARVVRRVAACCGQIPIAAVEDRLRDLAPELRSTALHLLVDFLPTDHLGAADSLTAALEDSNSAVRQAAATAHLKLALKEQVRTNTDPSFCQNWGEANSDMLDERLKGNAEAAVVAPTPSHSIEEDVEDAQFPGSRSHLREHTTKVLIRLSLQRHQGTLDFMTGFLEHANVDVRWAALGVLHAHADRNDTRAMALALARLDDPEADVRLAALAALQHIAGRHNEAVVMAVAERVCDSTAHVRHAAAETLVVLCQPGDPNLLKRMLQLLEHPQSDVRSTAAEVLCLVAQGDDAQSVTMLEARLSNSNPDTRHAAARALVRMAARGGGSAAINAFGRVLEDPVSAIRRVAVRALAELMEPAHPSIYAVVASCMNHSDTGVRRAAVESLGELASKDGNAHVAAVQLGVMLKDSSAGVRRTAVEMLRKLATKGGNAKACMLLRTCLQHEDAVVRQAAELQQPILTW